MARKIMIPKQDEIQKVSGINKKLIAIICVIIICIVGLYFFLIGQSSGPHILPPQVDAGNGQSVLVNESVTFNGTGTDAEYQIILYEWDFDGDGSFDWQSTINGSTTHTYTIPGNYTARFRVTNSENVTNVDTCIIEVEPHVASLTILNHRSFVNPQNVFEIIGEVQNTGNVNLMDIKITAYFYDINDVLVGYPNSTTYVNILKPGQKSPFMIARYEGSHHYTLEATYLETETQPYDSFEILNESSGYISIWGQDVFQINGEIKNGKQTANSIEIIVTFYDSTDRIIGGGSAGWVNPSNLNPSEVGTFRFNVSPDYLAGTIDNYAIQFQCS